MALERRNTLPCGRDPLDVIDAARTGTTDQHTATCPHCRAVLAAQQQQQQIIDELDSTTTPAPESLLPAVMATVWSELRPGRRIPLRTDGGSTFVTELAITSILQRDLEQLPNLDIQRCRVHLTDDDKQPAVDAATYSEPALRVEITAEAAYPTDLLALAATIRTQIARTLDKQFRLSAHTIDINFVDLYDAGETS